MANKSRLYESLTPFVSLTLGLPNLPMTDAALAAKALGGVAQLLAPDVRAKTVLNVVQGPAHKGAGGVAVGAFHYKRRVVPGWTTDEAIVDLENHLVVTVALKGRVALHFSDFRLRGPVRANLSADVHKDLPLSWLFPVPRGLMSAAFLKDGETRTLWLSGTHRRNALKADAKILSGVDLDYALDPLEDQSFFWSAARSRQSGLAVVIGVSPSSSRVWTRKAVDFNDFLAASKDVLIRLEATRKPVDAPFRYLASPLTSVQADTVHSAFDASIMPEELSADAEQDEHDAVALSTLVYETNLAVTPDKGTSPSFAVHANRNGQLLGSFHVEVSIDSSGKVKFKANSVRPIKSYADQLRTLAAQFVRGRGVNIRYDTGHSVSSGHVFLLASQRVQFSAYEGRDFNRYDGLSQFTKYDISKEKPSSLDRIGQEDSLFCWVQHHRLGWLACDDGSMEKADFIHLDETASPPVLSLIHVKAAGNASDNREISVAAYEVVTAQALKNLLRLDRDGLISGLTESVRASNHFWHKGAVAKKEDFIARLKGLPANHDKQVIVLQPHVRSSDLENLTPGTGIQGVRLDQLNTLLVAAQRTCNGVATRFNVICSE
jgi:hypothetical protein